MPSHKIANLKFKQMYKLYWAKIEKKSRTNSELNQLINWLTGCNEQELHSFSDEITLKTFFESAPKLNLSRHQITGSICGVKIEEISDPLTKEIRYLDKLVDELAQGKPMAKILRTN